jgi:hypothetical protein
MEHGRALRLGEIVLCRLTRRPGVVDRILEPDARGRRYYVRWQGVNPDFSLMAPDELLLPEGSSGPGVGPPV